jgi:hypothetical protein
MTRIGRPPLVPPDFDKLKADISAADVELRAKQEVAMNALHEAPDSSKKSAWKRAVRDRIGIEKAAHALLEDVAPIALNELLDASFHHQSLSSALRSFRALVDHYRYVEDKELSPGTSRLDFTAREMVLQDVRSIKRALEAAGECDALAQFPLAQLDLIAESAKKDVSALERARDSTVAKHKELTKIDLPADHPFTEFAKQALSAPDYENTRMGTFYPRSRLDYRKERYDSWEIFASTPRHEKTKANILELKNADDPHAALTQLYLDAISAPPESKNWKVTPEGLQSAIKHEALLPLRALNGAIDDILELRDAQGHEGAIKQVISEITQHILEGDYREWRYTNPASQVQLAALSGDQRGKWMSSLDGEARGPHGTQLKTREEDGVDLLWVTKIGGPSHGFDYGPNCLLPLLANGRTKAILVEDPRWPHNAAARCYLRVLKTEHDNPILFLEPLQRDFPHEKQFGEQEDGYFRFAQVKHAVEKARELGVRLSLRLSDGQYLERLGVDFKPEHRKFIIEPSAGVFEASDTLFEGHDLAQTKTMVSPRLERLLFEP